MLALIDLFTLGAIRQYCVLFGRNLYWRKLWLWSKFGLVDLLINSAHRISKKFRPLEVKLLMNLRISSYPSSPFSINVHLQLLS